MDNLEKFMLERREEFDAEVPSLKVWAGIDRHLEKRPMPKIVWMRRLRMAAAIAVLVVAGAVAGSYITSKFKAEKSLADVSPELAEAERIYQQQIQEKLAQLASYRQDGYVQSDLQELDAVYEELKRELETVPAGNKGEIIQAMITNYQMKVDILEKVLEKVESTNPTNPTFFKTEENEISL